ncbi:MULTISPECIES: type II toxin-antitoxin system RelE/ParE family toxin [Pseudomonas]|jgi:putative addiction module killer protein|uniref:type II toxin-antitoxin system RelE/ParE family toxin n=1 Tax=Pseudomonas TaxID=286 RepID=UPI0005BA4318|nr:MULTISPECIES: type II toxin-antitoxin system RelE/ParE family toxin [Pseudomonas]MDU9415545.1 type II toxin-antitoxin system RelE/ParE family toxin [Pseudomonas sp. zfem005]MDW3712915.1 type II toxin-antitoxin system RelE/ParE family toxin [Pseudomonas sp. 2023EL-01195]
MYEVNHAHTDNGVDLYQAWLDSLRDTKAKARITTRVERAAQGNFGDSEPVGEGVSELKFHFGPGYRVYYVISGGEILLLLGGGTKQRQQNDIEQAIQIWRAIKGD